MATGGAIGPPAPIGGGPLLEVEGGPIGWAPKDGGPFCEVDGGPGGPRLRLARLFVGCPGGPPMGGGPPGLGAV